MISFITRIFFTLISLKVVKFLLMGFILVSASELVNLLIDVFIPEFSNICNFFNSIPSQVGFFLQFFEIPYAISTILTAYVMRFAIRRLPFVG